MTHYVELISEKVEKQFSAMTFIYKNNIVVAYRGTDHTFVGWKEDLNMSFLKKIPAQIEAKKYLEDIMKKFKGNVILTGHSKGGNLAVYAGGFVDKKYINRIKSIFNFDGPNLNNTLSIKLKEKNIIPKIKKLFHRVQL